MNKKFRMGWLILVIGIVLGLGDWQQKGQAASTITVTSLADGAANVANCPGASCRLRDAIAKAVGGDTITFSVTGTITLNSQVLVIYKNLTIQGPGAAQLTISGNNQYRVFQIDVGTVALNDLTIANGGDGFPGGGIRNAGTLTLTNSKLTGNYAASNGISGGGIMNTGTLTITGCTLSGNSAGNGGGIGNEGTLTIINSTLSNNTSRFAGGIYNNQDATLTIRNSTLVGNTTSYDGGGLYMYFSGATITNSTISGNSADADGGGISNHSGSLRLTNCTITNNSASDSGGGVSNVGTTLYSNTIIAGNTATNSAPDVEYQAGSFTSLGYNLIGIKSDVHVFEETGDQQGTPASPINPLLAPLANYGGPTQTHALLPGSPAIDASGAATDPTTGQAIATDQRGLPRPRDLSVPNAGGGNGSDIGAFELQNNPTLAINPATLPAGAVGSTYSQTLSATGGSGNYSFSFSSGILPPGLAISAGGQISGTPTLGGSFSFTVTARDNNQFEVYGTRTYTIKIQSDCATAPSGLVDWWRAEGNANDAVGGNHGTLNGSAAISTVAEGQVGRAFKFDGTNGYVALPDNLFPFPVSGSGNTPFSFELWFKSAPSGGVILGQQDVAPYNTFAGNVPAIYVGTDGKLRVKMFWNNSVTPLVSTGTVNDNLNFHHLTIIYNGPQEIVYLDGQVMGAASHTQTSYNGSYKYQLGTGAVSGWPAASTANGGWFNFTGLIDEPSLYNRALTPQEVQTMYGTGIAGKCLPCPTINATVTGGGAICSGGSATVTVTLTSGVAPYTVTLTNGGGTKSGSSPLSFSVSPTTATTYAVQAATDANGCAVTATGSATVTIKAATAINTPPTNQTACVGSTVTFSVAATGTGLSYQWRKNGTNINGATSTSYTTPATTIADNGALYSVVVTGTCGTPVTSSNATLTVNAATAINTQPASKTVCVGATATFSVGAAGAGLTYQWRKNGGNISGAASSSYTTPATTAAGNGALYSVVVTGTCGTPVTSSNATLTVNVATAINTQPASQTVCVGSAASFSVAATGAGLTYQWRKNGTNISGATASSYTTPATTAADNGALYSVVVTGTCGTSVTSSNATLTVNPATAISTPPADQTVCAGATATFSVVATGTNLSYQWRKNGGNISGAASSSYTTPVTTAADNGALYSVVVTGTCGTPVTSSNATLTVNECQPTTGLQFYPLAHPIRLLDTRANATGCDAPGVMISGQTSRTQTAAGRMCDGLTIPANAKALTGNVTTVESGGGFLTLYPSDITRPLVANSNFAANQVLNNVFTVGLGAGDGAFNIFVTTNTNVVVDITGYYAPPSVSGLYFHPLPHPVRLMDSRVGATACFTPGALLTAGSTMSQIGTTTCDGVPIPVGAQALVGNATTVNAQANGFLTLFPADAIRPLIASSNFQTGISMNAPFSVGLSPSGQFNIYTAATTDLVVDVSGYYSTQLNDSNGQGLLFNPLPTPVRLLDTRAGQSGCFTPGAQMIGGTAYLQAATGACTGIPAAAKAVVGNATTVNVAANGFLTFWPSDAGQPIVATSNYRSSQVFNRHFTVGLGADGAFKRFASTTTDLIVDISGFFAP